MQQSALGLNGAFTAPHQAATAAGRDVLARGGTAIEAMVAAAAVIATVYPHMNSIGGDGFWLIHRPGQDPIGIDASGGAAALATPALYDGRTEIPTRGPLAALTVPGTIGGWAAALDLPGRGTQSLHSLLAPAIAHAEGGIAVTESQARNLAAKIDGLRDVPGFAGVHCPDGLPARGDILRQPALAACFRRLAEAGLDDFYTGDIAATHARFLTQADSPLRAGDLAAYAPRRVAPLAVQLRQGRVFNMPPPTQGLSSLGILGIYDRICAEAADGFDHVHRLVEATKQAFRLRNAHLGDPLSMDVPPGDLITPARLTDLAGKVDPARAAPWPHRPGEGDTIWMGAADHDGCVVSFIQSVYWEYGSGLTCPDTGVTFQNRGAAFSLTPGPNQLTPGRRPFHTLNPALAQLKDGRVMAYGTMGGEGQPQTQAAIFTRHVLHGVPLAEAIARPRWLLGRTWGDATTSLKLESDAAPDLARALAAAGHELELVPPLSEMMGHAGAVLRHESGLFEAATDPRSDGAALCL